MLQIYPYTPNMHLTPSSPQVSMVYLINQTCGLKDQTSYTIFIILTNKQASWPKMKCDQYNTKVKFQT